MVSESAFPEADAHQMIWLWADKFGLRDWDVRFTPKPADDGLLAQVDFRTAEKVAQIRVAEDVPDEEVLEACIVHEMLHLALKPYTIPTERLLATLSEPLRTIMAGQLEDAEEEIIETLVRAFGFDRYRPTGELVELWPAFVPGSL